MTTYTIGQVAERTGFTASALRYYEANGLLGPVGRTDAGYRIYDDDTIARLQFIARAKELGCTLDEIAELAELWAADDCGPVQRRLHHLVTDRIADAQRRSAELRQFTAQLQTAAAHLGGEPVDGACDDECACLGGAGSTRDPMSIMLGDRAHAAIACTLPAAEMPGRADDWHQLLGHVIERHGLPDEATGIRLVLDPDVPMHELTQFAVDEHGCCSFFSFALTVDGRGIALEVRAPTDAGDLVSALFGVSS